MHISKLLYHLLVVIAPLGAMAQPQVVCEQIPAEGWEFAKVMKPSSSDLGSKAKIYARGNTPIPSCLPVQGLNLGLMPYKARLLRDFFSFSDADDKGGFILYDLGSVQPVSRINTFSGHGGQGEGWTEIHDGSRGPQVYTVYGSAVETDDPSDIASKDWVKIADVDGRPQDPQADWKGHYGVDIKPKEGESLLGKYRWIQWEVKSTHKPGADRAQWTDTWYTEMDVHTPETEKQGGDSKIAGQQLEEIIICFKTHFDIGFTHPAPEIVDVYRTGMIDHALNIMDESDKLPAEQRFSWTIPSWVAHQILWEGQDPARRDRVLKAMKDGRLVVHGLPVTLHTESMDVEDIVFSLSLNKKMSDEVGIPASFSGKMTDVPSHSWVLPTIFNKAGMKFLHLGTNPGNEKPDIPLMYYWEGPDGSRILTMHPQGYGSDNEFGKGLYPPKDWPYKHWLAMLVTSDNAGPPSLGDVERVMNEAKERFPNTKIRLGKMEDFADGIFEEEKAGAVIPVVKADQPDRWIHGVGSMPQGETLAHETRSKLSTVSLLNTLLEIWGINPVDISKDLFNARERSMMYGEHTWGGNKNLQGLNAYAQEDFEKFIEQDGTAQFLEKTWKDHVDYIGKSSEIANALSEKSLSDLASEIAIAGDQVLLYNPLPWKRNALINLPDGDTLMVKNIPASGYKALPLPKNKAKNEQSAPLDLAVLENDALKITVDRKKGGIVSILRKKDQREFVDQNAPHAFGQYLLERFDSKQLNDYQEGCVHLSTVYGFNARICRGWNIRADLPTHLSYTEAAAQLDEMKLRKTSSTQELVLTSQPKGIIESQVVTTITLPHESDWFEINVELKDKKPQYWPEAGSIYLPVEAKAPQFRVGRLGSVVDPTKDFVKNCNRTYYYVHTGMMIGDQDGSGLAITPLDQGIISLGDKGIYTISYDYVPTTPVAKAYMFNNLWTVNFPYWIKGHVQSRLRVWPVDQLTPAALNVPALEALHTPLTYVSQKTEKGNLPQEKKGISLSKKGVRITTFHDIAGEGKLLRLWDYSGESGTVTVELPDKKTFQYAQPVNLRDEPITEKPITVIQGKFDIDLKAYSPASFILK